MPTPPEAARKPLFIALGGSFFGGASTARQRRSSLGISDRHDSAPALKGAVYLDAPLIHPATSTVENMKLTIIGGSKGTGAHLAQAALAAGHEVTVVSRSGLAPHKAHVVTGSATDISVVTEAVRGASAVVITVGGTKGATFPRTEVTKTVIQAMKDTGARRVIVQSSLGAGDSAQLLPLFLRLVTPLVLAKPLKDHNAQEDAVHHSGLDWTVVRPAGLKDDEPTGHWKALQVGDDDTLKGSIPRADLAAYILSIVEDSTTFGKDFGVSS